MNATGDVLLIVCLVVHVVATLILYGHIASRGKHRHARTRTLDSRA